MKRFQSRTFWVLCAFALAGLFSLPGTVAAEEALSRDAAVDMALEAGGGLAGVLPATAGMAVQPGVPVPVPVAPGLASPAGGGVADRGGDASFFDQKAELIGMNGNVRVFHEGSSEWKDASKGTILEAGDHVVTGDNSFAVIAYDRYYMNVVRIDANTKAEFKSIEPTELYLRDGRIYNLIDGLKPGAGMKIRTPIAVAAVRGTHFFAEYTADLKEFLAATVPQFDPEAHWVIVEALAEQSFIGVPEGKQLGYTEGGSFGPGDLKDIDPDLLKEAEQFFDELVQQIESFIDKREEGKKQSQSNLLPPTSGEFGNAGDLNAVPGSVTGGDEQLLDPLVDTGSGEPGGASEPESPSDPFFEEDGGEEYDPCLYDPYCNNGPDGEPV